MENNNVKKCGRCNKLKLKIEFHVDNLRKDKLKYACKECMKQYRFTSEYKYLEKIRIIKNRDRQLFLQNEKLNKLKDEYLCNLIELKFKLINNDFKEIPGYNNYFINKCGEVYKICSFNFFRKNKYIKQIRLKEHLNYWGYKTVTIKKERRIHQLMAITFLNHIPNGHKLVIDHIDGNKLNNSISNLQIVTNHQNLTKGRYFKTKEEKFLKYINDIKY